LKSLKRISMAVAFTGAFTLFASVALASPTLCYYSFSNPWGSGSLTSPIDSPEFTVANSSGYVTVYGWQSSPYAGTPKVIYDLMKVETWFDTQIGRTTISGTYPRYGQWYKHTFTGATVNANHYIKMTPASSTGMDGAGNAYDGL